MIAAAKINIVSATMTPIIKKLFLFVFNSLLMYKQFSMLTGVMSPPERTGPCLRLRLQKTWRHFIFELREFPDTGQEGSQSSSDNDTFCCFREVWPWRRPDLSPRSG